MVLAKCTLLWCHVIQCCVTLCGVMLYCVVSRYVVSHYTVLCHVMWCHVIRCCVTVCGVTSYGVVSCYEVSCLIHWLYATNITSVILLYIKGKMSYFSVIYQLIFTTFTSHNHLRLMPNMEDIVCVCVCVCVCKSCYQHIDIAVLIYNAIITELCTYEHIFEHNYSDFKSWDVT